MDYASIKCPVYLIGGWADGYTNPLFRMLNHLQIPNKAMVEHPDSTTARIAASRARISTSFTKCAAGGRTGWAAKTVGSCRSRGIALYIQNGAPPTSYETYTPGRWRFLDSWPPEGVVQRPYYLCEQGSLSQSPEKNAGVDAYRYQATVGAAAGVWCAVAGLDGMTRDQSTDECRSLTFTS